VKVAGLRRYVYQTTGQHGRVIDVYVSRKRDTGAARRFHATSQAAHGEPVEVIIDRTPALARVIDVLIPEAFHNTGQYENNRCECDHGRLKVRLRPMPGLRTNRTSSARDPGALIRLRTCDAVTTNSEPTRLPAGRLAAAFHELALAI